MNDPIRLREAGDSFDARLLDWARDESASKQVHDRVRGALGLGTTIAVASTTTTAVGATNGATKLAILSGAKWFGGLVVAGVAVGGVSAYVDPPTVPHVRAVQSAMPPTRPAAILIERPTAPLVDRSPPIPSSLPSARPPRVVAPALAPSSSGLSAEIVPIDAARAAFESGDAALALEQIQKHDREFPRGQLAPEALALRVEVHASTHDDGKVRELARRFLDRYPTHPQAGRMRTLAEGASP